MYNTRNYVPITTADGSMTLLDQDSELHFRSLRGARSESEYVFFDSSRLNTQPFPWRVLELGLGTGLNFLVTAQHHLRHQKENPGARLEYHVVEASPLPIRALKALQHESQFAAELCALLSESVSHSQMGQVSQVHKSGISIFLYHDFWQNVKLPESLQVQAIYHDPFGPKDNPDCWTVECFQWSGKHLSEKGRLVTYAANTPLRRAMVEAGLFIGSQKGSQQKREMTVAASQLSALKGLHNLEILRKKTYYLSCLDRRPSKADIA